MLIYEPIGDNFTRIRSDADGGQLLRLTDGAVFAEAVQRRESRVAYAELLPEVKAAKAASKRKKAAK